MSFWVETDQGFWGPWTREAALEMAEGRPVVGEGPDGWPDRKYRFEVVRRDELDRVEVARDQWRANALRLSKQLEEALAKVAELEAEAERLR